MTHQQWVKLSDEEKQQKMEKLCGFTRHNDDKFGTYTTFRGNLWKNKLYGNYKIPDFLNDLNAMHEAEELLNTKQMVCYVDMLASNMNIPFICGWDCETASILVRATAKQRAEAFAITMEKI